MLVLARAGSVRYQYDVKVIADRILFQGPSRQADSRAPDPHTRAGEKHKVDAGGLPDCIKAPSYFQYTEREDLKGGGLQTASQLCINQGMTRGPLKVSEPLEAAWLVVWTWNHVGEAESQGDSKPVPTRDTHE